VFERPQKLIEINKMVLRASFQTGKTIEITEIIETDD
jgi:hypothetical protein